MHRADAESNQNIPLNQNEAVEEGGRTFVVEEVLRLGAERNVWFLHDEQRPRLALEVDSVEADE